MKKTSKEVLKCHPGHHMLFTSEWIPSSTAPLSSMIPTWLSSVCKSLPILLLRGCSGKTTVARNDVVPLWTSLVLVKSLKKKKTFI